MKKRAVLFLILILSLCVLASCSERPAPTEFSVAFSTDGGGEIPSVFTDEVSEPPQPHKEGYVFEGWYETEDFSTKRVSFPYYPLKNLTLYAKYVDVNVGNEELIFTLSENGESYILTAYEGDSHAVVVPKTHQGLPVVSVADGFLEDYYGIREFYFSSAIEKIEESFYYCPNLEGFYRIDEGAGVYDARDGVLYKDGGRTLVKYPVALKENKVYLTDFSIPEGTEILENNAFRNAFRLKSVTLPASLVSTGNNFSGLTSLENIFASGGAFFSTNGVLYSADKSVLLLYPAGKTDKTYVIADETVTVKDGAFEGAQFEDLVLGDKTENFSPPTEVGNLLSFGVKNNPFFAVKDGVLYDKDFTTLLRYPTAKDGEDFSVPDGVKIISSYAFYGVRNLKELVLPPCVEEVKAYAFCGGENGKLEKIVFLPESSLAVLDGSAFTACSFLKEVYLSSRTPPSTDTELLAEGSFFIYVPVNTEKFYKTQWAQISSVIYSSEEFLTPYNVSFRCNGGTEIDAYDTVFIASEPVTVREGYEFGGWFAEPDFGGEKIRFPVALFENTVLYAYWIKK